jgi:sterol desaturase/sphingolipid hydroxylase (fatty acid hydroxylase superfamily)
MLETNIIFYYIYINFIYYLIGGIFYLIDYYNIFVTYKIQLDQAQFILSTYKKIIYQVTLNTFIYMIPFCIVGGIHDMNYKDDFSMEKCFWDIIIGLPLTDFFFYTLHKLFHTKYLYTFHKKHHEIIAPVGISALYMSATDMYFGNIIPIALPAIILNYHPITVKIWISLAILNTIAAAHSGFDIISNFHDYHHSNFNKNFGANVFMDRLFGTYH